MVELKGTQKVVFEQLREDAVNSAEVFSTKALEYYFNKVIFTGSEFVYASQQPPSGNNPNDARGDYGRQDGALDKYSPNRPWGLSRRLGSQAKKLDCTGEELQTCEFQAYQDCLSYCDRTGEKTLWEMTSFGLNVRLWAYRHGDDYLTPFFPRGNYLADKTQYVDIQYIPMQIWDNVKNYHEVPDRVFAQDVLSNDSSTLNLKATTSNPATSWNLFPMPPTGTSSYSIAGPSDVYDTSAAGTSIYDKQGLPAAIDPDDDLPDASDDDLPDAPDDDLPDAPVDEAAQASRNNSSSAPLDSASKGKTRAKRWQQVDVTEVKHTTSSNEWRFTDVKGKRKITKKNQWTRDQDNNGVACWTYEGHTTKYYTYHK